MLLIILLFSIVLIAASGLPAMAFRRRSNRGQILTTILLTAGCAIGMGTLAAYGLGERRVWHLVLPWSTPLGRPAFTLDALGALFLLPIFGISALGSAYGIGYWPQTRNPANGRKLGIFWGWMSAGMALVVLAGQVLVFLAGWEFMAISGYFLLTTEDSDSAARHAGWIYFIATHIATLALVAFFILLHLIHGSLVLWPVHLSGTPGSLAAAMFVLGLTGFGLKAGLVPLHVWLPGAHAVAPSHVSALFSGVMLTMGVYGLVRIAGLFAQPPLWWGITFMALGIISAFLGIVWAMAQQDFKKMMAFSSIENMGIVTVGLGLAELGLTLHQPILVTLGLIGALLHMVNHSLFKPLLFMGAGGIIHATGQRTMDSLGGLAKPMPRTFVLMTLGVMAITGLPPLNGFVSEWIIYLGLLHTTVEKSSLSLIAVVAVMLAMTGALALAVFTTWISTCFTGKPRGAAPARAHDPSGFMLVPMAILGVLCLLIGIVPVLVTPALSSALAAWQPDLRLPAITAILPLRSFTLPILSLLLLCVAAWMVSTIWRRRTGNFTNRTGTWDCGYAMPNGRMAYSGASLLQIGARLFRGIILSRRQTPDIRGLFPAPARFDRATPDPLLNQLIEPAANRAGDFAVAARAIQGGKVHLYVLYIFLILLILLTCMVFAG